MQISFTESAFRSDCDRIVRARAFRRLAGKTQVVPLPRGDHLRTRLTHVLEVTSIARRIARALALDESLAEAIALAHDLGHPPFGHVGERVLAHASGGFHHAAHGVRVVDVVEPMGLSPEVRAGILLHSKGKGPILPRGGAASVPHATREAAVTRVADLIAYASHDADDALRTGYLCESELPRTVRDFLGAQGASAELALPERLADAFARDVVGASDASGTIAMSPQGEAALDAMRALLYERFYERRELLAYVPKIREVLTAVYDAAVKRHGERAGLDLVAGMTDRRAVAKYDELRRTRVRRSVAREVGGEASVDRARPTLA